MSDTNTNNTSIKVLENPESGSSVVANTEATNDSSKHDTEHEQKDVEMEAQDNEKETRTEQPASPPKSALKNTTTSNSNSKNVKLPVARIKRIVKQDGDVVAISTPAVYAVAAATELFVNYFTQQAYMRASSSTSSASTSADGSAAGKKKRVAYKDFANSVEQLESLQFLSQLIPQPKKLSELVSRDLVARPELPKNQSTLLFSKAFNKGGIANGENSSNGNSASAILDTEDEMLELGNGTTKSSGTRDSNEANSNDANNDYNKENENGEFNSQAVHDAWASRSDLLIQPPGNGRIPGSTVRRESTLGSVLNKVDEDGDVSMVESKSTITTINNNTSSTTNISSTTVSLRNLLE